MLDGEDKKSFSVCDVTFELLLSHFSYFGQVHFFTTCMECDIVFWPISSWAIPGKFLLWLITERTRYNAK